MLTIIIEQMVPVAENKRWDFILWNFQLFFDNGHVFISLTNSRVTQKPQTNKQTSKQTNKQTCPYFNTVCLIKLCYVKQVILQHYSYMDLIHDACVYDNTFPTHETLRGHDKKSFVFKQCPYTSFVHFLHWICLTSIPFIAISITLCW